MHTFCISVQKYIKTRSYLLVFGQNVHYLHGKHSTGWKSVCNLSYNNNIQNIPETLIYFVNLSKQHIWVTPDWVTT